MINRYNWHKYLIGYLFELPTYLFHEVSHWIMALVLCPITAGFYIPRIRIDRWFECEADQKGSQTTSWKMHVHHFGLIRTDSLDNFLVALAPAISTIVLFIVSPWYLDIIWLSQLNWLWLSGGDTRKVVKYLRKQVNIIKLILFRRSMKELFR